MVVKKYIVTTKTTLKEFTDVTSPQASLCFRALLKNREIRVNGTKVGADCALKPNDEVVYFLTDAQAEKKGFFILYEDENATVVDKESGVNSEAVFAALSEQRETYFIHRLDRNTEGLIIFGHTVSAEEALKSCFRERRVEKIYHALVIGTMPKRHEICKAYLQKDEKTATVRISGKSEPHAVEICTEYKVLEERGETSLIKITLHTGKTHQIRAHMAFLGHPVVGDEKYGDSAFNKAHHATRQRLLAKELTLHLDGALSYLDGKKFTSRKNL